MQTEIIANQDQKGKHKMKQISISKANPPIPLTYNLASIAAGLIALPYVLTTLVKSKRRATFLQRLGLSQTGRQFSKGRRPIWVHALSVGEVLSAEPIVEKLLSVSQDRPLVFSASTLTGYETAQRQFATKVDALFYYPYDIFFSVKKVVNAINPAIVVIVETDIWPNFMYCLKKRRIPALLVNARMSKKSFKGYRLLGNTLRRAMEGFDTIAAQSEVDSKRFRKLGVAAEKVQVTGNVKFEQQSDGFSNDMGEALRLALGIRLECRVMLFGSTHSGEEEVILSAYLALKGQQTDRLNLLAIVVPRDPGRADRIVKMIRNKGLKARLLSSLSPTEPLNDTDVLVVNTIGILRKLYQVADVAFIGGSLVRAGGHNPLEAAAAAKPILFGPDMSDFLEVAYILESKGAATRVDDIDGMRAAIDRLLADDRLRKEMGQQAYRIFCLNQGAVDKTMALISQFMP